MKSISCFILTVIFALSVFGAILCAVDDIRAAGWHKTTLTITDIGLPDGVVFGDYTDAAGQNHENEAVLNWGGSFRSNSVEQYYGQKITILCGTEKGDVLDYESLIKNNIISFGLMFISGFLLYFGFFRKKTGYAKQYRAAQKQTEENTPLNNECE